MLARRQIYLRCETKWELTQRNQRRITFLWPFLLEGYFVWSSNFEPLSQHCCSLLWAPQATVLSLKQYKLKWYKRHRVLSSSNIKCVKSTWSSCYLARWMGRDLDVLEGYFWKWHLRWSSILLKLIRKDSETLSSEDVFDRLPVEIDHTPKHILQCFIELPKFPAIV